MALVRNNLLARVWRGRDPFAAFPRHLYEVDTQGWGSNHPYLLQAFEGRRPAVAIEIGVWKGASSILMASEMRRLGIDGVLFCVDTWLGSSEHWLHEPYFESLAADHGFPSLHRKFMNNIVSNDLQGFVIPVPLDSLNAAELLRHHAIQADLIHLDAAHDYASVVSDLKAWWPLLRPGGMLIGDDYYSDGAWPGVKQAFDELAAPLGLSPLEHTAGKCRLVKPG